MRRPDGGTRPAYNLELATDCDSHAIVGVEATNAGSDAGQDAPVRDQVDAQANEAVEEQLMDGGCLTSVLAYNVVHLGPSLLSG